MLTELASILKEMMVADDRPMVIYSAMWPFSVQLQLPPEEVCEFLLQTIMENLRATQTVFVPTFTKGYGNGSCNLDTEPSTTGLLTEKFRLLPQTKRTISAFFSFCAYGRDAAYASELKAEHAWGEGSLYAWFHRMDANIITLGTHPTHCSFTHRAEWLARDVIRYRFVKEFRGEIIRDGVSFENREKLFVRDISPTPVIDWTWLLYRFIENGMRIIDYHGIKISSMSAKTKMDIIVPLLYKDPLALIKNREELERKYHA